MYFNLIQICFIFIFKSNFWKSGTEVWINDLTDMVYTWRWIQICIHNSYNFIKSTRLIEWNLSKLLCRVCLGQRKKPSIFNLLKRNVWYIAMSVLFYTLVYFCYIRILLALFEIVTIVINISLIICFLLGFPE